VGESLKYVISKQESFEWKLRRTFVFWCYLFDFVKNGEFYLVWILIKSLFVNKSNPKDLIINTYYGKFLLRKNTMDFKMANIAYEQYVIKFFKQELVNKQVVIDIGSNCGLYSIIAALEGIKTFAFEPIADNFNALNKNIELNNLGHLITAFNIALGNKEEKMEFNYNHYNTGSASKFQTRFETTKRDVEIKVFDNLQIPEFIGLNNVQVKLDVEGMEVPVIEGMQEFIKSTSNICFFIETKHAGVKSIQEALMHISTFEFIQIDPFNMFAEKIN